MLKNQTLKEKIHQANVEVHRSEAKYYELIHPEVYSKREQKRISVLLERINKQIANNQKNALDVGAGTGNLTDKLLHMGYKVTAIDISAEMCAIIRKKHSMHLNDKLTVINSPLEDLNFAKGTFDLIAGYSVLHHLPDYLASLQTLCGLLKKGGVIYIDHEASPFYWKNEPSSLAELIKGLYFHSNPLINSFYFQITDLRVPSIDYTLSDYWHKKEHSINHRAIALIFKQAGFERFERTDYHLNGAMFPNPLFYFYRLLCRPETSYWIAKK